ncbi:MAG TPA: hypothetical protein ENG55_00525 [Candidatus Omnitrophica bacterium]|nr:hypothetical protein [Candidatus Omnitrophota bacterium]
MKAMRFFRFKDSLFSYLTLGFIIGGLVVFFVIITSKEDIPRISEYQRPKYKVEKVIDGDTIRLDNGDIIRLIGIDTPELHHHEIPVQVFAKEASQFTKGLCEGFNVYLEYDKERQGKYGRTLAYVYLEDGRMVNEELLKRGYAYVLRRFPFSKKKEFLELQRRARLENRGLWSLNLSYGRLANIAVRFDRLTEEGKRRFDEILDEMLLKYSKEEIDESD